jgi:hypothetical protein
MKLPLIAVFVFLSASFESEAQVEILNKNIGWRGDVELYSIKTDSPQQRLLFLFSADSIRMLIFDHPGIISREFYVNRFLYDNFLGASKDGDRVYLFLRHRQPEGLLNYVFNLKAQTVDQSFVPFETGEEKMIGSLGSGGRFVFLTADRKKSQFILYIWQNEESYDTLNFPFKNNKVGDQLSFATLIEPETNMAKVYSEGESGVIIASKPNKLYLVGDSVYFIMNNNDGVASIYGFDIANKKSFYREISPNNIYKSGDKSIKNNYVDNSFLKDDNLYFVSATYNNLDISISDFNTGKLLKDFTCTKTDLISFKNTPILEEGSSALLEYTEPGSTKPKETEKTSQLLKKMVNSKSSIEAINDSGGISIAVGSYNNVVAGGYMTPNTSGFSSSWEPRTTWVNSTHFKMLIDSKNFEHIDGRMKQSLNVRIEEYLKGIEVPKNGKTIFNIEGNHYVSYYDNKKRSLVLIKFL